ncbi:MAG: flavodoxin family protein [Thermodesulfobacteriota bacterium]
MKVIVINAAPRMEAGNTQMVLTPFLVGIRHAGGQVDMVSLGSHKIEPCQGCFTCYAATPGECIHQDDMPALVERVQAADMMILATPVYLDGMTSLAKVFVDRLVVFLDPHFEEDEEGMRHPLRKKFPSRLFLVSVCGYPGLHNFDPLLAHVRRIARNFHTEFAGALLRPAVFSLLLNRKYPDRVREVMDSIRRAGEELVREGKVSSPTSDAVAVDICSNRELMVTANAYWDRELEKSRDQPA